MDHIPKPFRHVEIDGEEDQLVIVLCNDRSLIKRYYTVITTSELMQQ